MNVANVKKEKGQKRGLGFGLSKYVGIEVCCSSSLATGGFYTVGLRVFQGNPNPYNQNYSNTSPLILNIPGAHDICNNKEGF